MDQDSIWNFLNKQRSPEAERIADYLIKNPDILDKFLGSHEWNETESHWMPEHFWKEVWIEMEKKRKSSARVVWLKRITVAATILAAAMMLYIYHFNTQQPNELIADKQTGIPDQRTVINQTDRLMNVYLPDSSLAVLSPQASITYAPRFLPDKRNVSLQGKARFDIVKDKDRPFTVFAGGLATTALGTAFTIDNRASENISIRLHNGRVVIRQAGETDKLWKKDIYLLPGEQLDYNFISMTASVRPIYEDKIVSSSAPVKKRKNEAKTDNEDEMTFVNSPLTEVIKKIEKRFKTQIVYDSLDIAESNFTGTFSQSDSVGIVLKIIAQMNSLEVLETNGGHELRKLKDQ